MNATRAKTFFVYTLGCKVNWCDSEALTRAAARAGWQQVDDARAAVLGIINTCTVTAHADATARKVIRQMHRRHPAMHLCVMGCCARVAAEELARMTEVDAVLPTHDPAEVVSAMERWYSEVGKLKSCEVHESISSEVPNIGRPLNRTRRFVKVQDGCGQFCAYCRVPYARGTPRSLPLTDICDTVRQAADEGIKEIVLTGIHLAGYNDAGRDIVTLIRCVLDLDVLPRVRVSSLDARAVTPELTEMMGTCGALLPHLHVPLQSGSDRILERMHRQSRVKDFETALERVLSSHPLATVSTDIMVGFPGEREEDFALTLAQVDRWPLLKVHMFRFSPRAGTAAAGRHNEFVPAATARAREEILRAQAERAAARCRNMFTTATFKVLVEQCEEGEWQGFTENYLRVGMRAQDVRSGEIVTVDMSDANTRFLPMG